MYEMYYKVEFLFHYISISTSLYKREWDKLMEDLRVSVLSADNSVMQHKLGKAKL